MKWTTDKPTVGGWYFWRQASKVKDPFKWRPIFIEDRAVWVNQTQMSPPLDGEWSGPIPEPEDE